ncbi:hypothetical protein [Streptomyces sp. P5_D11]
MRTAHAPHADTVQYADEADPDGPSSFTNKWQADPGGLLDRIDDCAVGLGEVDGVVAGSGSDVQDSLSGQWAEHVVSGADTVPEAPAQLFG